MIDGAVEVTLEARASPLSATMLEPTSGGIGSLSEFFRTSLVRPIGNTSP